MLSSVRRLFASMACLLMLSLMAVSGAHAAATKLENINFSALPGDGFEVRLDFDGAPPEPKAYTIEQPARIVLDLPAIKNALAVKKHALSFGNAKSVVIMEGQDRTRVIVNLVELATYESRAESNSLFIEVGSNGESDYLKAVPETQVERRLTNVGSDSDSLIRNIDFRRGELGEGEVVIDLANPLVDVDADFVGGDIILRFVDVGLPQELQRRLDVRDFATPVEQIEAMVDAGSSVIKISPTGEYDYLAYQADNQYVVSVKPLTEEEIEEKKERFVFVGEKLSLNFQDIEVRSVLQLIADFTGLNLVASDTVSGKITLRLQNVPWDQALDLVLKTKGLDKRQIGNVLLIAPAAEIAERERQEIEANKQIEQLAPLRTEHFRVLYADAKEIFELLTGKGEGSSAKSGKKQDGHLISKRGNAIVDERTNTLIISETQDRLNRIRRLVKVLDVPIRQVMIEARIVVAQSDFARDLGVDWSASENTAGPGATNGGVFLGQNSAVGIPGLQLDLGVDKPGQTTLSLGFREGDYLLDLELSALESSGHGEVVSQPKVITGDKQTAFIESGKEVPYLQSTSSGAASIAFKKAVLKLEVTPHITPDDRIIMDLQIEQGDIGELTFEGVPTIDTTEVETQVLVNNGETVVLGGIFKINELVSETKTPLLGDIPWIGNLFKKTSKQSEKVETLIFVTPRILTERLID